MVTAKTSHTIYSLVPRPLWVRDYTITTYSMYVRTRDRTTSGTTYVHGQSCRISSGLPRSSAEESMRMRIIIPRGTATI